MRGLKTVIFDMDGLMFNTETLYYRANQAAADEMGLPFSWDYFERFVGSSEQALYTSLTETFSSDKKARHFILRSAEIALDLMQEEEIEKKPGLDPLLSYLKERNLNLMIGSNSQRKVIDLLLNKSNVAHYFNDYVGVDDVARGKPSPDIYLKALQQAKVKGQEALVLEDSVHGVQAAYEANIPVIMVPDLEQPTEEAKRIALNIYTDLNDVHNYLKSKKI